MSNTFEASAMDGSGCHGVQWAGHNNSSSHVSMKNSLGTQGTFQGTAVIHEENKKMQQGQDTLKYRQY